MLESEAIRPTTPPKASPRPTRVLVAEDNPLNQKLFQMILGSEGIDVVLADNGKVAVEAIESDPNFDLVLMDVQMPEMDGLEATRKIRENPLTCSIPVIAVTAYLLEVGRDTCLEVGMNDYVEKPFRRETILETLRKWVRR